MLQIVLLILVILGALLLFSLIGQIFELIIALVIWALIGWLAGKLMRGSGYGALTNILLGLGGGLIGGLLFRLIGLGGVGGIAIIGPIITGVVGAIVLIFIVRLLTNNKRFGT